MTDRDAELEYGQGPDVYTQWRFTQRTRHEQDRCRCVAAAVRLEEFANEEGEA